MPHSIFEKELNSIGAFFPNSPILKSHYQSLQLAFGPMPENLERIEPLIWFLDRMVKCENLGVYENSFFDLQTKHSIPVERSQIILGELEKNAKLYLFLCATHFMKFQTMKKVEKLKKVVAKAEKLRDFIDDSDLEFFSVLAMAQTLETQRNNQKFEISDTIENLQKTIRRLSDLYKKLPDTFMGESLRLGKPSKDANLVLDTWIASTYSIWTKKLERTTKFDKNGVNGRKRCVGFLYDSLQPLHPEIEYSTVKSALNKHLRSSNKLIPIQKTREE